MRFHWFHLMPYQNLPDDFSTTQSSVWVTVPSNLYDPLEGHRIYNEYLDELEFADQVGFDGICVNEHHQNAYGMMPSPNLMAATLARRTSNAAIVVLGNSIALYNPPTRVAEEMAMLDVISGGRLIAGFPVGTPMDTAYCYGQPPAIVREKYGEAHDLIMKAWTSEDVFSFNGKYTQLRYVNTWPKPIQKPHPPIWIPGSGSVETWEWSAERDYLYSYLSFGGYKRAATLIQGYWDTLDRLGVEHNPNRVGYLQLVIVADTDAEAEKEYAQHVQYFYDKCQHIGPTWGAPGFRSIATLRSRGQEQFTERTSAPPGPRMQALSTEKTWKERIENGSIIAGSPATVRDQLKDVIETMHVGHLMVLMQLGDMPKEKVLRSTELFAKEVMPHLRHYYSEYEDRWYPKPLSVDQRTAPAPIS